MDHQARIQILVAPSSQLAAVMVAERSVGNGAIDLVLLVVQEVALQVAIQVVLEIPHQQHRPRETTAAMQFNGLARVVEEFLEQEHLLLHQLSAEKVGLECLTLSGGQEFVFLRAEEVLSLLAEPQEMAEIVVLLQTPITTKAQQASSMQLTRVPIRAPVVEEVATGQRALIR
jgi:hypothetical protein